MVKTTTSSQRSMTAREQYIKDFVNRRKIVVRNCLRTDLEKEKIKGNRIERR